METSSVNHKAPRQEAAGGSGGIIPRVLNLRTRWRGVVSFTRRPLSSREKSHRYSIAEVNVAMNWTSG